MTMGTLAFKIPTYDLRSAVSVIESVERDAEQEEDGERTFDAYTFSAIIAKEKRGFLTVNVFPEDSVLTGSRGRRVVDTIEIDPPCQRRGIASMLFAHAVERLGPIEHSEWQTEDGKAWSASLA